LHRFDTDQECDGRTDGQTLTWTMVKTREALHAVARKKAELVTIRCLSSWFYKKNDWL